MDKLTAFKVAFLSRCAEEGLDLDQIHERVKEALSRVAAKLKPAETEKVANPVLTGMGVATGMGLANKDWSNIFGGLVGGLTGFVNSPENTPASDFAHAAPGAFVGYNHKKILPLLIGGGALLAGGGLAAGKMLADSTDDPMAADQVKQQELLNEYKRLTDKTKRQMKFRQLKG